MEARLYRAVLLWAVLVGSMGAVYRTPNFVVQTSDPLLAEQFAKAAEQYRRQLAIAWLGETMPQWSQPCMVTAYVGPHLAAGGATTFVFDRGEVYGWRMTIQGSAERILDSVLPHEITHMIFACRFRRPLPRWADEGAATTVEHPSERAKHYKMLLQFLQSGRGIPFGRMFAMEEYPPDMMPLYAQGYTLAEFLIQQGGKGKFLDFLAEGMQQGQWSAAVWRHYGYRDVGALQHAWLAWVRQGFPAIHLPPSRPGQREQAGMLAASARPQAAVLPASGWHAAGQHRKAAPAAVAVEAAAAAPIRAQLSHPQPLQSPRQVILQWQRLPAAGGSYGLGGATLPVIRK